MIVLTVTPAHCQEMSDMLLDFGEKHDLSLAELYYVVAVAVSESGYQIKEREDERKSKVSNVTVI